MRTWLKTLRFCLCGRASFTPACDAIPSCLGFMGDFGSVQSHVPAVVRLWLHHAPNAAAPPCARTVLWVSHDRPNATMPLTPFTPPSTHIQVHKLRLLPTAHLACSPDRLTGDGAHIPLLDDVLPVLRDGGVKVTIELKGGETEELSVEAARRHNMLEMVTFSSFWHDRIQKVKQIEPNASTAALFGPSIPDNVADYARGIGADEV